MVLSSLICSPWMNINAESEQGLYFLHVLVKAELFLMHPRMQRTLDRMILIVEII